VKHRKDNTYTLEYNYPKSIGYIAPFYGNFLVYLRAYAYCMLLGGKGLGEASQNAVLNANYMMNKLKDVYKLPYDMPCMHEFVLSAVKQAEKGVKALDIAKALIDRGFHPPTIYFPLIVKEAMMIEPTECESKETLDSFIQAMRDIAAQAEIDPIPLQNAPITTPIGRPNELQAAKMMDLSA
jgi:glycine dehydrogenase subunit 2